MRRFTWGLVAVAVFALGARVVVALVVVPELSPAFDPELIHQLGTHLADGDGYIRPPALNGGADTGPTAEFAPLTPSLVAAAALVGIDAPHTQGLVLALVGTLTVVAVGFLGRATAGDAAGLAAAAITAGNPLLVQIDAVLTTESPYLLLVSCALLLAVRAARQPTARAFALLGLVIGTAALARAEGLLLVLLVAATALAARVAARRAAALALAGVLGMVVVVAPWTVRNAIRFGELVPVSNNIGSVLAGANCPTTYAGERLGSWDFGCVAELAAESPELRIAPGGPDEAAVYGEWRQRGLSYAGAHLDELPRVVAARVARTWGVFWHPSNQLDRDVAEGRHRGLQTAGFVVQFVLLVLAAGTCAAWWRAGRPRRWLVSLLVVPCVLALAVPAATVGQTRQRTVAEPVLAVAGAVAVVRGVRRVRRLRARVPLAAES